MNLPMRAPSRAEVVRCVLIAMLFAAACFGVSMIGGCTSSPIEKSYTVSTMYEQAQRDLITLREAKAIPDAEYNQLADLNATLAPAIKEMNRSAIEASADGSSWASKVRFNSLYDEARKRLDAFLLKLATAKPEGK